MPRLTEETRTKRTSLKAAQKLRYSQSQLSKASAIFQESPSADNLESLMACALDYRLEVKSCIEFWDHSDPDFNSNRKRDEGYATHCLRTADAILEDNGQ